MLDGVNPVQGTLIPRKAPAPAETHKTAIGLTFFAGLRPGEARGASWEHYDGKTLCVKQSVWRKHATNPKTASAAKPVPAIEPLRELLSELWTVEGEPSSGPVLRGVKGKPLSLDMLAREVIRLTPQPR